jgi:hypothetical protein
LEANVRFDLALVRERPDGDMDADQLADSQHVV